MPHRRPAASGKLSSRSRWGFRERSDELEGRRIELIARLQLLSKNTQRHPGYRHALKLLTYTYRRQKLTGRLEVLRAASWLIGVLEQIATLT